MAIDRHPKIREPTPEYSCILPNIDLKSISNTKVQHGSIVFLYSQDRTN